MIVEKKIFSGGGINNDDTTRLLGTGDYLNLQNGRVSISENGKDERIESIPGTTQLTNNKYPPYGNNICIGSCIDIEGKRLVWFICNTSNDHGIYVYDFTAQQIYAVIYDSQVTGGLNFNKNYRIDRNCKVVNGVLYWTDNYNEPKKINLDKAIKANQSSYVTSATPYSLPIAYTTLTVIRRPPYYNPTASKQNDYSFLQNFVASQAYQMCYYYDYVDNETSRLSSFSALMNFNVSGGTTNYISVTIPFSEYIDDDIQRVNICAKNLTINQISIIKTFDKAIPADLAAINAHNAGTTQLSYNYYGNVASNPLDSSQSSVPFDSVSLQSKTLEFAINRLMFGNNLNGYNTTSYSSLAISQNLIVGGVMPQTLFKSGSSYNVSIAFFDRYRRKCGVFQSFLTTNTPDFIYSGNSITNNIVGSLQFTLSNTNALNEIPSWAYYYQIFITQNLTKDSFLSFIFNDASYVYKNTDGTLNFTQTTYDSSKTYAVGIDISNLTAAGLGYTYNVGDQAVIKLNSGTNYSLPVIGQSGSYVLLAAKNIGAITNSFKWTFNPISLTHATYTLPMTLLNNYQQTGFAVQSTNFADLGSPAYNNQNWGINVTDGNSYTFFISGNISLMATATYPSDYIKVTVFVSGSGKTDITTDLSIQNGVANGTTYTLSWGTNITIPAGYTKLIVVYETSQGGIYPTITGGYLTASRASDLNYIEIYTQHKSLGTQEPYYEATPVYAITNPATNTRQYGTLTDSIAGDTYGVQRNILYSGTTYQLEAMSPNDLYWQNWYRSLGWVNYILQVGQTTNPHEIRWSNTFVSGTRNNGLSRFDALDYKTTPLQTGQIQKLQLASKTEEQGVVMLSIGAFQTTSCYLSEVQVVGASQNAFLAQDTSVIGTMNVLKGMFGTTSPETVIEYLGLLFWYDLNNGVIVQYSSNGLEAISHYKMTSFFQKYAKNYLAASSSNLDNINGFHHIPTSINPFTKRFQVTTPGLIYSNYANILPSYSSVPSYASSIINRFNVYTQLAQTVCYDMVANRWKETFEYAGEWYDYFENIMIGFKNGTIYTHETNTTSGNWNTFYGVQYPLRIWTTANASPSEIKDLYNIAVESNAIPDYTVGYADYPNIQITDLISSNYINNEGVMDAQFFKDRLSPNTPAGNTAEQNLYQGDFIKDVTLKIMCEFQQYSSLIFINFIDVGYSVSRGNKQIIVKPS